MLKKYLEKDDKDRSSSNDFGKNVIPDMLRCGQKLMAFPFKGAESRHAQVGLNAKDGKLVPADDKQPASFLVVHYYQAVIQGVSNPLDDELSGIRLQ